MARRKTQGRKKIEMKKIESEDARRITFSKRRNGLFKKASELSTLCGVQIAIIVYSIGGKAFSFGHPSVESVINRFENENRKKKDDYITKFANAIREARLRGMNQQFNDLNEKIADERKKQKAFKIRFQNFGCRSFEDFIDQLGPCEIEQVKEKMKKLKEYVAQEINEGSAEGSSKCLQQSSLPIVAKKEINGSPVPYDWLKL